MKGRRFIPLVVVAAGLLAYQNSFTGSFFHDDVGSILENQTIRHLWPIWQPLSPPHQVTLTSGVTVEGRPLINLSLAINYALGGYNVWGYHALNLAVHLLAGLTLLGIVRRTLVRMAGTRSTASMAAQQRSPTNARPRWKADDATFLSLAVAVLWTVHPLQTESVTYVIQRAESIMGLFYLLTLYCFIRGGESRTPRLWYGLSVIVCALGMACKEVMITAPVMVVFYDRAFLARSFREAWRRHWPLYLALASTWILQGLVLASGGNLTSAMKNARHIGISSWEYLATQPGAILYYLRLSFWPSSLRLLHEWPIARTWLAILPPAIVVVILLGAVAWAWRKNPAWGFVGVWFFLTLAPSSSIVPALDAVSEHRMYLSLAGVVSLVVLGLYSVAGRRSVAVFVVAAIALGFLTWQQNKIYQKDPHYSLGFALQRAGRNQEAVEQFEQALRVAPDDPWLHYNLGAALYHSGRLSEAIAQYEYVLQLNPDFAEAHRNLGIVLKDQDRLPEAIEQWEQLLRLEPRNAQAHCHLGVALDRLGRVPEAIRHYEQALQIDPDNAEAHTGLGVALARLGRVPEAITHWERALRIKPDYAEAHYNLGVALDNSGRVPEAIEHYEQALQFKPDDAVAHYNLGVVLARLGRVTEAVKHWELALRIKPDYAEAHYNLGVALEQAGRVTEAIGHYEQALRVRPDFTAARDRLARLRRPEQ